MVNKHVSQCVAMHMGFATLLLIMETVFDHSSGRIMKKRSSKQKDSPTADNSVKVCSNSL